MEYSGLQKIMPRALLALDYLSNQIIAAARKKRNKTRLHAPIVYDHNATAAACQRYSAQYILSQFTITLNIALNITLKYELYKRVTYLYPKCNLICTREIPIVITGIKNFRQILFQQQTIIYARYYN